MRHMTKSQATTPIPVQLSGPEFIAFIFPHVWTAPRMQEENDTDGRIDCDHVSGLFMRLTAGPDGVRDPVPNTFCGFESLCGKRDFWIVGSTDRHLILLFHPGINARFERPPAGAGRT